jgi:type II secretory pathway pseudopilin PulG
MYMKHARAQQGVSIVEVVIGVSIAGIVLIFAANTIALFINTGRSVAERTAALYLAEEGMELVRFVHDGSWDVLSGLNTNNTHYLNVTPTSVAITATPEVVGDYTRSFRIQNIYRNGSDDIVASTTAGSVADTSAKYVTMTVLWGSPTQSVSLQSIVADLDP